MWRTLHSIVDLDYSKTLTLMETLKTQNRPRSDFCVTSGVERSFPQVGCVRHKTSVSHSSTEAEVLSLDAGLRLDGIHACALWDFVNEVLHSSSNQPKARGNLLREKH